MMMVDLVVRLIEQENSVINLVSFEGVGRRQKLNG